VLISHNHYDHLDVDTLRWLAERDDPVVVVPLGVGATVRRLGFSTVHELDWDQAVDAGPLRIVGQQVRHFSGRGLFDRNRSLWLGFVVQGPTRRWYFAGDTGDGPHFAATGAAHGPFDLALLPIGAYAPRWFMSPIHIGPDEAVAAHVALRAERSLGVHHGTFRLTSEPQDEPVQRLAEAVAEAGLEPWRFEALEPGRAMVLLPRG
jgi:N-acyl-phosphatidylethanolamine-hydrolysing phospholipase D